MARSTSEHLVATIDHGEAPSLQPKQPYLAAVRGIAGAVPGVEALFDHFGRVRTLKAVDGSASGLFTRPYSGNPIAYAEEFLKSAEARKALGLQHAEFFDPVACSGVDHRCVTFVQKLTIEGQEYRVRRGYVQVYLDESTGAVFQVNSTVRHGRKPSTTGHLITAEEALAAACDYLAIDSCLRHRVELVMSAHRDRFDPCYEVVVTTHAPRRVVELLIKGSTGEVVHVENKLRASLRTAGGIKLDSKALPAGARRPRKRTNAPPTPPGPVFGRSFLEIPDAKVPLSQQVHDVILDALPDKTVLKNDNVIVYLGGRKREVGCKPDGTFMYRPEDPEFAAVLTFFVFHSQMELMKRFGLKAPKEPMLVFVDDPAVRDNAYFDPETGEIHIGIGSGVNRGGLTRKIAYDWGVTTHENGHNIVFIQSDENDLPGTEGGAIHESTGDVLGTLLMEWWFKADYGSQLRKTLTVKDVEDDERIIGKYALPGSGIRKQKHKLRTPQDKTGQVHDDGLISGGAQSDLLVAMIKAASTVKEGMEEFARITLLALSLLPRHKVLFVDLLNAYITADQRLYGGKHKSAIVKAFDDHGITLKPANKGRWPVIVVIG